MAEAPVYFPTDETHNAEVFARGHRESVRYVTGRGFRVFDGIAWRTDIEDLVVMRKLLDHMDEMAQAADTIADPKMRMQALHSISKFRNSPQIRGTISVLRAAKGIPIPGVELNSDPLLLNVQNGTINLRTHELQPHSHKDMITKCAPVRFDPIAECPMWEAFVAKITQTKDGQTRPELAALLQRIVGYLLTGKCSEQVAFFFYGTGANGKGTLLNTLRLLLGDYATTTNSETFIRTHGDQHPTAIADLSEAHLVWCDELSEDAVLNENLLKTITGEGPRKARYMRKDFFEFIPRFKIVFTTNALPTVSGEDRAIWRRIIPIPFDLVIPHSERDHAINDRLATELSGILNWALKGCTEWQAQGLSPDSVECVRTLRQDYKEEEDTIRDVLNGFCSFGDQFVVAADMLYDAYVRACSRIMQRPLAKSHFSRRLLAKGYVVVRQSQKRFWRGLTLTTLADQQAEASFPAEVVHPEDDDDDEVLPQ